MSNIIYRDRLYFDPDFPPEVDEQDTHFQVTSLCRTRDALEFIFKAYPQSVYDGKAGLILYEHIAVNTWEISTIESLHDYIHDRLDEFKYVYYNEEWVDNYQQRSELEIIPTNQRAWIRVGDLTRE